MKKDGLLQCSRECMSKQKCCQKTECRFFINFEKIKLNGFIIRVNKTIILKISGFGKTKERVFLINLSRNGRL